MKAIATALVRGREAHADIITIAVTEAMTKAGIQIASTVILFLTPEFALDPKPALLAAARAANCTQIIGCSAVGIFTENEWVLDAPAVAAMVMDSSVNFVTETDPQDNDALLLTLAAPTALNTTWLSAPGQRFGGVSGDATGQGPFKVWNNGKVAGNGRMEGRFQGTTGVIGVSQGVRPLSEAHEITKVSGYDVLTLTSQPALNVLTRELPLEARNMDTLPLHFLMAGVTFGDPQHAIDEGRFRLMPIISANTDDRSVTLSARLTPGERLFWALRQPLAAERDMRLTLDRMQVSSPDFGLFFPCAGRGPYFYGGVDRDLDLVKQRYPGMPLIGFYGNGEIAPLNGENLMFQYSAVLGLFNCNV